MQHVVENIRDQTKPCISLISITYNMSTFPMSTKTCTSIMAARSPFKTVFDIHIIENIIEVSTMNEQGKGQIFVLWGIASK